MWLALHRLHGGRDGPPSAWCEDRCALPPRRPPERTRLVVVDWNVPAPATPCLSLTAKLRSAANGSPARGRGAGAAAQIAAGYDVELLEGPERVAAREPALAGGSVIGAVHAPRSAHVEPMEAAVAIADAAVSLGGARLLEDARVTAIRALPAGDGGGGERGTVGPSILQLSVATLRRRESFLRV
jgi:hypothetical protein